MTHSESAAFGDVLEAQSAAAPIELRALSLKTIFTWTFVGNLAYAGCQWGMLVALAKLGSPERVRRSTLRVMVTTPVTILTDPNKGIFTRDPADDHALGHTQPIQAQTPGMKLRALSGFLEIACRGTRR